MKEEGDSLLSQLWTGFIPPVEAGDTARPYPWPPPAPPCPPGYLQINLSWRGIWAGLVDEVLQLGFPQRVSLGSHRGVADRGGPWGGLVDGDLVGAICPSSLGEAPTWTGVVIGEPPECKKRTVGKEGRACLPSHAWKRLELSTAHLLTYVWVPHLIWH